MMIRRWLIGVLGWVLVAMCGVSCTSDVVAEDAGDGIAVVELFTSEGCSSCPPADALLGEIVKDAERSGRRVYCLSMHVDYWNRLGWKDPYSDATYSRRQRVYGKRMKLRGVYTPQMLVNGTEQFVGSDRGKATQAINAALAQKVSASVELAAKVDGHKVNVSYKVAGVVDDAVLCVAYVQKHAVSHPDRGENGGRKLEHFNVVREFQIVKLDGAGEGELTLTRPNDAAGQVIGFVQKADGRIAGADGIDVE